MLKCEQLCLRSDEMGWKHVLAKGQQKRWLTESGCKEKELGLKGRDGLFSYVTELLGYSHLITKLPLSPFIIQYFFFLPSSS